MICAVAKEFFTDFANSMISANTSVVSAIKKGMFAFVSNYATACIANAWLNVATYFNVIKIVIYVLERPNIFFSIVAINNASDSYFFTV